MFDTRACELRPALATLARQVMPHLELCRQRHVLAATLAQRNDNQADEKRQDLPTAYIRETKYMPAQKQLALGHQLRHYQRPAERQVPVAQLGTLVDATLTAALVVARNRDRLSDLRAGALDTASPAPFEKRFGK